MTPVIVAMSLACALTAYTIFDQYAEFITTQEITQETDFTDTGVGCIDDCLDPMEERK